MSNQVEVHERVWLAAFRGAQAAGFRHVDAGDIAQDVVVLFLTALETHPGRWHTSVERWAWVCGHNAAKRAGQRAARFPSLDALIGSEESTSGEKLLEDSSWNDESHVNRHTMWEWGRMVGPVLDDLDNLQCPACAVFDRCCPDLPVLKAIVLGVRDRLMCGPSTDTEEHFEFVDERTLRSIAGDIGVCTPNVVNKGTGAGARWFNLDGPGIHVAFLIHAVTADLGADDARVRLVRDTALGTRSRCRSSSKRWTPELELGIARWFARHGEEWLSAA